MVPSMLHVLHGGTHESSSGEMLWQWSATPGVLLGLTLSGVVYALGVARLWSAAGVGHGIKKRQVVSFAAGLATMGIALVSPVDALADELQWVHMVQHLLLIGVVPPLLLLGQPMRAGTWALPAAIRSRTFEIVAKRPPLAVIARTAAAPGVAFVLHATTLLLWHIPGPYDAAVQSDAIHAMEHLSFLLTATLFWWVVLAPAAFRRLTMALKVPFIVGMSLLGGGIGAVLTFASTPLYRAYAETTRAWGFTPLEDQQVAGLIMWIPGGVLYLVAAAIAFVRWLDRMPAPDEASRPAPGDASRDASAHLYTLG